MPDVSATMCHSFPERLQRVSVKWENVSFPVPMNGRRPIPPARRGEAEPAAEPRTKISRRPPAARVMFASVLGLALVLGAGCAAPAVRQQRLVAKPNMTFSDSVAFAYNSSRLLPQLATGLAAAGGPQNSGCTSCR